MVLANDVAPSFSSDLLASRRSKILCQTCSVDSVGLDALLSELVTPESGDAWVKLSSATRTPPMAATSLAATVASPSPSIAYLPITAFLSLINLAATPDGVKLKKMRVEL